MEGGGLFSLRNKTLGVSKRIKISRACDECRKRKVKKKEKRGVMMTTNFYKLR